MGSLTEEKLHNNRCSGTGSRKRLVHERHLGSLDYSTEAKPNNHIFVETKLPWIGPIGVTNILSGFKPADTNALQLAVPLCKPKRGRTALWRGKLLL